MDGFLWVWHLHPSFVYSIAPYLSKAKGLCIPEFLIRELKVPGDKASNNSLISLRIIPHEPPKHESVSQSREGRKSGTLERKASLNQTLRSKYKRLITQVLSHLQTQEVFISFRWLPLPWSCPVPHVSTMETGLHITWKMYKALPTSVAEIGKWQLSLGKGHHGAPSYSPQRLSSYRQGSYLHLSGLLLIYPAAPRKSCLCLLTMKDSLARGHGHSQVT